MIFQTDWDVLVSVKLRYNRKRGGLPGPPLSTPLTINLNCNKIFSCRQTYNFLGFSSKYNLTQLRGLTSSKVNSLFIYLFICLFVCLFVYLFIYLFIYSQTSLRRTPSGPASTVRLIEAQDNMTPVLCIIVNLTIWPINTQSLLTVWSK